MGRKLLFAVNEPYFFVSHRLDLALGAKAVGYEVHVAAPDENVWSPEGFNTRPFFASHGIIYHDIPMTRRGMNPLEEWVTARSLCRLYRKISPDIVHHITAKLVVYGGFAARVAGIPAVVSAFPGLGHYFSASGLSELLVRWFLVQGYRVVTGHQNSWAIIQNPDDAKTLESLGVIHPNRTLITRGSGVSLDEFKPSAPPEGPPLVVLPARMIWEKGVGEFVEVARQLRGSNLGIRFALVGNTHPSNPRAVPEKLLKAWHEEGLVEWWGRRDDMPAVIAAAHVICLPSTYGEGIPKVLLEAAASGRPIVTYDVPGCRETVIDGVSGILVPRDDRKTLARVIQRLLEDRQLCVRMGREARALAESEFGVERVIEQTLGVYEKLLLSDLPHEENSTVSQ